MWYCKRSPISSKCYRGSAKSLKFNRVNTFHAKKRKLQKHKKIIIMIKRNKKLSKWTTFFLKYTMGIGAIIVQCLFTDKLYIFTFDTSCDFF